MAASPYQSYRSSDVRGLDQIPAHWEEERAKHFFRPVDERSETGEEQLLSVAENRGVELRDDEKVNMRKAESYEGYKLCQPGDLVINSMWAWKRGLGISDYSGIISTAYSVFRLRDSSLFEEKYLDWLLRTDLYVGEYLCRSQGVWKSRLTLSDREFLDIPIIRPPIEEQRAIIHEIGDTLDDIEAYIAKKGKLIDLLKTQRRAVINRAVTQGLDDGMEMTDSGVEWLGEIPAHWDEIRLRYATSYVTSGSRGWGQYYDEDGHALFVRIGNLRSDSIELDLGDTEYLTLPENAEGKRTRLEAGDVLVSITAEIGSVGVVPEDIGEAYVNQHVALTRPRTELIDPEWMGYALLSRMARPQLRSVLYGGTKDGLSLADVKDVSLFVPPKDEQRRIVDHIQESVTAIEAAIGQAERQIELMEQYHTSLVAEVVTGQMDVRNEVAA